MPGDYVTLLGAEQVSRAGHTIDAAAQTMVRAAMMIDESNRQHQHFMTNWLAEFSAALERNKTP